MKRVFILLFAVCLTLPLFGCKGGDADSKPADAPAAEDGGGASDEDSGKTAE